MNNKTLIGHFSQMFRCPKCGGDSWEILETDEIKTRNCKYDDPIFKNIKIKFPIKILCRISSQKEKRFYFRRDRLNIISTNLNWMLGYYRAIYDFHCTKCLYFKTFYSTDGVNFITKEDNAGSIVPYGKIFRF